MNNINEEEYYDSDPLSEESIYSENLIDSFEMYEELEENEESSENSELFVVDEVEYQPIDVDDMMAGVKKKRKSTKIKEVDKSYYIDPVDFHNTVKDYIVTKKVNPDHVISRKLGLMFEKIIEGVFSRNNFRNYFNGWKDDMKSKAREHVCRYSHRFDIHFSETTEFMLKWLFRVHEDYLKEWYEEQNLSKTYDEFKDSLKDVRIRDFYKGKRRRVKDADEVIIPKTRKDIDIITLKKLFWEKEVEFNEEEFKNYFFEKYSSIKLAENYKKYQDRNAFNYFTQMISNCGKYVLSSENMRNDTKLSLEEGAYYKTEGYDHDKSDYNGRFMVSHDSNLDWGVGIW